MLQLWPRSRAGLGLHLRRHLCAAATASSNAPAPTTPTPTAQLIVRNLAMGATADEVRAAFEAVCIVRGVTVPMRGVSGASLASRGIAFVEVDADQCNSVRELIHGTVLGDRVLDVKVATLDSRRAIGLNNDLVNCHTATEVLAVFERGGDSFNGVNFGTALHKIAILGNVPAGGRPKLQLLAERAALSMASSADWEPRSIASACWAAARLGVPVPQLFAASAIEAKKKILRYAAKDLASLAWAFAEARIEAPVLFKAVAFAAQKRLNSFNAQALANLSWAFARAGFEAPQLFRLISDEAVKK
ncbi:hypothetical protein M885DRAFT_479327, partial [Pelagophyceae sp. CCMP2097]